jgi:hypothetical protein
MATLTIVIKGIALIVENNGVWKVYMPFAGCHRANLSKEGELGQGVSLAHPDQKLSISGSNLAPLQAGANFDEVFDITGHDAHKDGVRLKFEWQLKTLEFSIPGGAYSADVSQSDFVLNSLSPSGAVTAVRNLGTIGTIGTISIEGEDLKIVAEGRENFTWEFPEGGALILDNDCHGIGDSSIKQGVSESSVPSPDGKDNNVDFQMLYLAVQDAADPTRRFQVKSDSDPFELPCNNHKVTKLV